jgi:beta-xylosidase
MHQLHVFVLTCVSLLIAGQVRAESAKNPVIWADVPDVAAIRVGDAYYMSSTTMHMSPGLPIMKSKDLVNWKLIGYAYDTLADNEALRLENGRNAYGAGSWASSFRYHNGTFYVSTFSRTSGRTHVYTTTDIEKGNWKEISFAPSLHDHSLFFDDDGRVYMLYGVGDLRLVELKPDLTGIKPDGFNEVVIRNASAVAGSNISLPAEGSQMLKVNGKYYVMNITWPRGGMRTQIIHRADKITGPYEGKVVLQDKGIAQGCLIDTPKGDWFALLFQDNGSVGRSPWLVPVKWEDGWPVLGVDGKAPITLDIDDAERGLGNLVVSDEFDRKPGEPLPLAWQWNHNPDGRYWSIGERSGYLRLTTGRVDSGALQARNMLTQRTFGPVCSATTKVEVGGMKDGDCAGLIALQRRYGFVGVKMQGDSKSIVMVSAQANTPEEIESLPLGQQTVHLRIDCDFRDRADKADFYYSLDGKAWTKIGATLQMAYTLPHFMGYRFGLFNFATQSAGGFVDFDYYRVSSELASAAPVVSRTDAPALPFATPLRWKSTGALVKPVSDANHTIVSVKDPTIVRYNDLWHIYATAYSTSARTWTMVYLNFKDWSDAPSAKLTFIDVNPHFTPNRYNCAPHLFYFTPHKKWYLVFQAQPPQYCTTEDISKPETWTKPQNFFDRQVRLPRLPIDYHVICDDTHAYLFFTGDDGNFYRSRTRIQDFPKGMSDPEIAIKDRRDNLFEASITYKIKGTNTYLTVIEAMSPARYYRAWVSDDLNGEWTPVPNADSWQTPFAGINNVTFEDGVTPWTRDISHGELIRDGYDERMILDPDNLQLLYQGRDPASGGRYELLPYQLGLLKLDRSGK